MLHDSIVKLQSYFVGADEVAAYRSMVPRTVSVKWRRDDDVYIAFLERVDEKSIEGLLITEGKTADELNYNLNQLIYINSKIPERIRPYYGNMFRLDIGAKTAKTGKLVLARA